MRTETATAISAPHNTLGKSRLIELEAGDVPRIAQLEIASWPAPMRVDETTVARRFDLGHVMLGVERDGLLLGVVAFSYTDWSPQAEGAFPSTNVEFNSQRRSEPFNTAFAYNLVVHPPMRGSSVTRRLIAAGLDRMCADGCRYLLGHSRCPSYNGSAVSGIEQIAAYPAFRRAIDRSMQNGTAPTLEELLLDPVLRFYSRALRCTFVRVMPDFLPGDEASGGIAIRFVKRLLPSRGRPRAGDDGHA